MGTHYASGNDDHLLVGSNDGHATSLGCRQRLGFSQRWAGVGRGLLERQPRRTSRGRECASYRRLFETRGAGQPRRRSIYVSLGSPHARNGSQQGHRLPRCQNDAPLMRWGGHDPHEKPWSRPYRPYDARPARRAPRWRAWFATFCIIARRLALTSRTGRRLGGTRRRAVQTGHTGACVPSGTGGRAHMAGVSESTAACFTKVSQPSRSPSPPTGR